MKNARRICGRTEMWQILKDSEMSREGQNCYFMCLEVKALVEKMVQMVITWIWKRSSQVLQVGLSFLFSIPPSFKAQLNSPLSVLSIDIFGSSQTSSSAQPQKVINNGKKVKEGHLACSRSFHPERVFSDARARLTSTSSFYWLLPFRPVASPLLSLAGYSCPRFSPPRPSPPPSSESTRSTQRQLQTCELEMIHPISSSFFLNIIRFCLSKNNELTRKINQYACV